MFDAKKLLDQFLGAETAAQVNDMLQKGLAQAGTTAKSGAEIAEQKANEMLGADKVKQAKDWVSSNQMATGAIVGGLAAVLLGTKAGRSLGGTALKAGALAGLAGLAYKAYQDWQGGSSAGGPAPTQAGTTALPAPTEGPFAPKAPAAEQELAKALVVAMISAAKADGYIDPTERAAILDRMAALPIEPEARAFVEAEFKAPLDIERVVAAAKSTEDATQIYAASLLCIDPDHPAEKAYLAALADKLGLAPGLVASVSQAVAGAKG